MRHLENIQSQKACDVIVLTHIVTQHECNTKYRKQRRIVTSVLARFLVLYLICDRIPNSGKSNIENLFAGKNLRAFALQVIASFSC